MLLSLHRVTLALFLLHVVSSNDLQPEPITYILKSYAEAFTTPKSLPTTLPPSTQRADISNSVYEPNPAGTKNVQSYSEDPDDHYEPPDHVIPYSEHEDPPEPATRPNYTAPGAWAKPPSDKNISLEFVPIKLYAQVRGTHSVKHVPREEAIKSAETEEEKANAARLKEVVKITKANTVYSEEGYEDAAYDHAGQIRDADFHEGFAKKLNENINVKGKGKGKGMRRRRKRPRRKGRNYNHFDLYKDHEENEARISQQQVKPDEVQSALNQSNVAKSVALEGIREIENDLKKEAEEIQRTSTEPVYTTVKSISRTDYDTTTEDSEVSKTTTTVKRDVTAAFTVRPKKITTPWPVRKVRRPYEKPATTTTTTESYEELLRQYVLNNPNLKPASSSSSPLQQALATVNGHGPYLVVVTSPANLVMSSSYEPLTSEANLHYYTMTPENRTRYNTVIESKNRKVQISGDVATHSLEEDEEDEEPRVKFDDLEFARFDESFKERPRKKEKDGEDEDDDDDYMLMRPPDEEESSTYSVVEDDAEEGRSPPDKFKKQKKRLPVPVTRLLPPSPLSASEYTSFQMRDRKGAEMMAMPPTVMAIIEAIHQKETKPMFPFLFRKKRSALGPSREWEIVQRDKRLRAKTRIGNRNDEKQPDEVKVLLEEPPKVALDVVDEEIRERFKDEASSEASTSDTSEDVNTNLKEESDDKGEQVKVEVSLPELDFSSNIDEDDEEIEPAVAKPAVVDRAKYPFYKNSEVLSTAVEYVINPSLVPKKSLGGMEFYNSRNRECEDIEPNLDELVPENEELESKRGPRKSKQRLQGLGDKMDCYKAKYFDENPLDNPLFYEKEVKMPPLPDELDPKKFASRISDLPREKDDYVVNKGPKNPEKLTRREKLLRKGQKQRASRPTHTRKTNSSSKQKNQRPSNYKMSNSGRVVPEQNPKPKKPKVPAYQTEVYQDVMGTILNLEKSKRYKHRPSHTRYREKASYSHHKPRPLEIDGMTPPPRRIRKKKPKNKYPYSDERNNYYDSNESAYPNSRIYKRSINVEYTKSPEQLLAELQDLKKEKTPFRIVFTTPLPPTTFTVNTEAITSTTEKQNTTVYVLGKNTKSTTQDFGRHGKFGDQENTTSSYDYRRNEPRYNLPRRNNVFVNITNTTQPEQKPLKLSFKDTTDFGSTFIPVIVKPDELTKSKLLEENKHVKSDDSDQDDKESPDKFGESKKTNNYFKSSKKRYSGPTPGDLEEEKVATLTDAYTIEPPVDEHKELTEFLKGDPPGYSKAFPDETTSYYDEKPKELLQKEESKVSKSYEKKDSSGEEGESSKSAEETSREATSAEGSSENEESKEAAQSEKNEEKNDEPFERFTDRPYSPPENYEDDRYSDLGPRINKPYFYHPPFKIPDYERSELRKSDDQNTSEETEDHETYVYPWETDDHHDDNDSKSYETTNAYEYPWDKKEKKDKKRESSRENYDAEENSEEATNTRPVYIPLGDDKHIRGKKDVTKEETDVSSKFSSKYKSDAIDKAGDKETSSSNVEEVKQTTESHLKDSIVSWPARATNTTNAELDESSATTTPSSRVGRTKATSTTKLDPRFRLRSSKDYLNRFNSNSRLTSPTRSIVTTTPAGFTRRRRVRNNSTDSSTSTTVYPTLPINRRRTRPTASSASSTVTTSPNDRRRRPFRVQPNVNNTPTSTVRTVAHHTRVSKQEIFTRTTYPDDDDDEDNVPEENSTSSYTTTSPPAKTRHGRKPTNEPQDEKNPKKKKKKIEKVVITMEKTPDHVYETKEVDRDGVKGKFVTITANNNSDTATAGDEDDLHMHDAEVEEMNRRKSADNSFSSMMRDTEDLVDKSSGVDDYMIGDLLQKSPLPASRKSQKDLKSSNNQTEEYDNNNNENDNEDEEENDGEEDDEDEEEGDDYEDHNNDKEDNNEDEETENDAETPKKELDDDKESKKNETIVHKVEEEISKKEENKNDSQKSKDSIVRRPSDDKDKKTYGYRKKLAIASKPTEKKEVRTSDNNSSRGRRTRPEDVTKTQIKRSAEEGKEEIQREWISTEKPIPGLVKDPGIRKYFYVESD